MTRLAAVLACAALASCSGGTSDPATCDCAPTPPPSTKLLANLQQHQRAVRDGQRNGRGTKLIDDEIRLQSSILCQPCYGWVAERALPEELYPLDRLDDAVAVVCTGLQLRDGTIAYGAAHPPACAR